MYFYVNYMWGVRLKLTIHRVPFVELKIQKKSIWTQGNWCTLGYLMNPPPHRHQPHLMHHCAALCSKRSSTWVTFIQVCLQAKTSLWVKPRGQNKELQLSGHASASPSLSMAMSKSVGEFSLCWWGMQFFPSLLNVRDSELWTCRGHSAPCW